MIRYTSLASSSAYGNAYLVEGGGTRLLIDCGARQRRLVADLARLGVDPATLDAVLLTHEHADHTYGLGLRRPLAAGHGVPLYAHPDVWRHCAAAQNYLERAGLSLSDELYLRPGAHLTIGAMTVIPFRTPHDAVCSLGFVIACGHQRLGLATDLGHVSAEVADNLCGCTHLVIESNHDRRLELDSGRPWPLVQRVLGANGHLSNRQTADALADLVGGMTRSILLAHLSLDCNRPELALTAAGGRLRASGWRGSLWAAPAGTPSGWLA